jgi:hypothetical protein
VVAQIERNDDRVDGDRNALAAVTLQPDVEYWLAVAGFDDAEVGAYTVEIRE